MRVLSDASAGNQSCASPETRVSVRERGHNYTRKYTLDAHTIKARRLLHHARKLRPIAVVLDPLRQVTSARVGQDALPGKNKLQGICERGGGRVRCNRGKASVVIDVMVWFWERYHLVKQGAVAQKQQVGCRQVCSCDEG